MEGSLSIDKLGFTARLDEPLWQPFRRGMRALGDPHRGGKHYREALEVDDPAGTGEKILFQWAPFLIRSAPFVRVEFNPTKARGYAQLFDRYILPFIDLNWRKAQITRIDPAVDYPVSLVEHVYYAGNHKGNAYYGKDGVETLYLGSAHSNIRLRIYDKAKELEKQGAPSLPHPLTRIEAQQRSPRLAAAHIDALPNPFRRLQVAHPTPEGVRYKYRLYLQAAQKYGVDHVVKRLKRYERRTFKDLLASMPPTIPHPSEVFMREYQRVCREQLAPFFVSETGCIRATDSERTEASEGI